MDKQKKMYSFVFEQYDSEMFYGNVVNMAVTR